jgi:hypothetical protein
MQQLLDDETVPFVASSAVVTTEGEVLELSQELGLARKVEFNGDGEPRLVYSKNMFDWSPSAEALTEGEQ